MSAAIKLPSGQIVVKSEVVAVVPGHARRKVEPSVHRIGASGEAVESGALVYLRSQPGAPISTTGSADDIALAVWGHYSEVPA